MQKKLNMHKICSLYLTIACLVGCHLYTAAK
jgi:hypothetical protein